MNILSLVKKAVCFQSSGNGFAQSILFVCMVCVIPFSAHADMGEAYEYVNTGKGKPEFYSSLKYLIEGSEKNVYQLPAPNNEFLLLICNNEAGESCTQDIQGEVETIGSLKDKGFPVIETSGQIDGLKCAKSDANGAFKEMGEMCSGFLEALLYGTFVNLSGEIVSRVGDTERCAKDEKTVKVGVTEALQNQEFKQKLDQQGIGASLSTISNTAYDSMRGIEDFQGIVSSNGTFTIIDPGGLEEDYDAYHCFHNWVCTLAKSFDDSAGCEFQVAEE